MMQYLAPIWAVSAVTWREAIRQRLWLVVALAGLVLLVAIPNIDAVDSSARLKLSVAMIVGTIGFVAMLLSMLIGAVYVRRDLDSRIGFMLFAKPLGHWRYVLGRWLGLQFLIAAAMLFLGGLGALSTWWQIGALPQPLEVAEAEERWVIAGGEALPVSRTRRRSWLTGTPQFGRGEGIRWKFSGLVPDQELLVLVKAIVNGYDQEYYVDASVVTMQAQTNEASTPIVLRLAESSKYGRGPEASEHEVILRNRGPAQSDLDQDYLRVVLPAGVVSDDGTVIIQVNRHDPQSTLGFDAPRDCLVAQPGDSFFANLMRALAAQWALVGLMSAAALLLSITGNVGVTLLGTMTIYFCGNGLEYVRAGMRSFRDNPIGHRTLDLFASIVPDFQRYGIDAQLAGSRMITLPTVIDAWQYYGMYTVALLLVAWFLLRRVDQ
jgi:hypothetical protein